MADLYGPAFGLASMGAALGDRFLAERDRDRQIAIQDRAFALQERQDARSQALADEQLLQARTKREDEEALLRAGNVQLGKSQFGEVPRETWTFDENGARLDYSGTPAFSGGATAMPTSGGTAGKGKKAEAGSAAPPVAGAPGKIGEKVAEGKAVFAMDHERLFKQAESYGAQAADLQARSQEILSKNPYPPGSRSALQWESSVTKRIEAQAAAYQKSANEAQTQAEAAKAVNYGKQAFFHLFNNDPQGAAPYLDALRIPKEMFVGMGKSKDGQYILLKGGNKVTWEMISAMTQGSPDDQMKAAAKLSDLVAKDMDRASKEREAAIQKDPNKDPRLQAIKQIEDLDAEYARLKAAGKNPESTEMKAIENKVANLKGAFNISRDERADKTNEVKKELADKNNAARITAAGVISTMGSLFNPFEWANIKRGTGIPGAAQPPASPAPAPAMAPSHAAPAPAAPAPAPAPAAPAPNPPSTVKPTVFAKNAKGERLALVNGQWVPWKG